MKKNDPPVIIEQVFTKPINTVWNSLIDPDQMRQWFFENIPSFKPEIGFETKFDVKSQDRVFPHLWKVVDVNPGIMITINWKYEGFSGDSLVKFELSEENGLTKLRLSVEILSSFQDDIPEFRRESCITGWEYFLKNRFKSYLEKLDKS